MFDIKVLRENPDLVKENIRKKYQDDKLPLVDTIFEKDELYRKKLQEVESLKHKRNICSQDINASLKAGKDKTSPEMKELFSQAKQLPKEIEALEAEVLTLRDEINDGLRRIPNLIHESVPIGKDDSENVELEKVGEPFTPDYEIHHHAEIAEYIGGVDFDSARKTSGNGFYYLQGDLARLHSAILAYARDYMIEKGFIYTIPPFLIRNNVVEGVMSFTERDAMMYKVEGEDLYLIGTSEHSMIGRYIGTTVEKANLPLALTSYSPCFRKEVGAHGIEEKGLYRLHQFEKQEMIVICEPEESYRWYEKMLQFTVDVFRALGIPVRKLECCSGDLADLKAKSADVEAWSPRQKKYYEVGSCSNLTDAQARRLNIRVRSGNEKYYPHTLNNTVIASPRALIALLENNQNKDGSITIPEVIRPLMGGKERILPKEGTQ